MSKDGEVKDDAKPVNVYQAIAMVQGELAKTGISKDKSNAQQGYKFRGIDDVYNALAPLLAETGLCILPEIESREVVEKATKSGGVLFYVTVRAKFAFVLASNGSKHEVVTYGEAMDSGDKATNKAMSAAYKYACLQTFCIPTEGDNDADATTHEVKSDTLFVTAQDRKAFIDGLLDHVGKSTTVADCRTVYDTNVGKLLMMKDSKDPADISAYKLFGTSYNAKVQSLKVGQQPQPAAKTVDAAVQTAGQALGSDTIDF